MPRTARKPSPRPPASANLPATLPAATLVDHDLEDEASFDRLEFGLALPDRHAEAVEFTECRFARADLSDCRLPKLRLRDSEVTGSNLANLQAEQATLLRSGLAKSRITGLQLHDGVLRDVLVTDCRADLTSWRFSSFTHVRFERCLLARADFSYARLGGVEFVDCDLTGAQFSHAEMTGARFRRCELAGIGGVTSFAGVTMSGQDLLALSYTLAGALGIELADDDATITD
ncbi:pentapeptide repeat-containing protein [Natronosporangium hydrolyticum]|uniref:Pentapeptide repeat-containing protein n=1 Tax=Natronosporangium hydrolyticum TaxID=2811111 RepID=A0A895YGQ1_9ACTN|nr:pentapeptide repeat-containing protein [Natronosporangium hydrolyticum]QSB14689.1 pentapeptide repeat-containing protein [Natronosporangium hydrolyticum]